MLESLIAIALFCALVRYVWVSLSRNPVDHEPDVAEALDSLRAALPVEVRESDFAVLADADKEVSRRQRVRAGASLPTLERTK